MDGPTGTDPVRPARRVPGAVPLGGACREPTAVPTRPAASDHGGAVERVHRASCSGGPSHPVIAHAPTERNPTETPASHHGECPPTAMTEPDMTRIMTTTTTTCSSPTAHADSFLRHNNHLHRRRGSEDPDGDDHHDDEDKQPLKRDLFGAAGSTHHRHSWFKTKRSDVLESLLPSLAAPRQQHRPQGRPWGRRWFPLPHRRLTILLQRLLLGLAMARLLSHVLWMRLQPWDATRTSLTDRRALDWYAAYSLTERPQTATPNIRPLQASQESAPVQDRRTYFQRPLSQPRDPEQRRQRQTRTQPRRLSPDQMRAELSIAEDSSVGPRTHSTITRLTPTHYDWPTYCANAGLSSSSRVWITNVVSSPPATALALLLAQQCQVQVIVGVDPMFPNLRRTRMALVHTRLRRLLRSIPGFSLQVPWSGLRKRTNSMEWVKAAQEPTHIIHFDTSWQWADMHQHYGLEEYMEPRCRNLWVGFHSQAVLYDMVATSIILSQTRGTPLPRLLHVTNANHTMESVRSIVSAWSDERLGLPTTHLMLPEYSMLGPLVQSFFATNTTSTSRSLHVDDAMAGLLMAMETSLRKKRLTLVPYPLEKGEQELGRQAAMEGWKQYVQDPYEIWSDPKDYDPKRRSMDFLTTFGLGQPQFPCSSQCASSNCVPSVFDAVRATSRNATKECQVVLYYTTFSATLEDLVKPQGAPDERLCRIAFVSGKSALVSKALAAELKEPGPYTEQQLMEWNGKIKWHRWILLWLPKDDDGSISDADNGLLRIDPSGMFSSRVKNALYVESLDFAAANDASILSVVKRIDRPAIMSKKVKERRSGIPSISRSLHYPPEAARKAILFAGEPPSSAIPKSIQDFAQMAGDEFHIPKRQLLFYELAAHLVQSNDFRPEKEIRLTHYFSFPFQWISKVVIIHNLKLNESRDLRCSWLEEYLFWGGNREAEELSLAYTLAVRRIQGRLGSTLENEDGSWNPLLKEGCDEGDECRVVHEHSELFIRLMKRKETTQ